MAPVPNKRFAIAARLRKLAAIKPPLYYRWAQHAVPNAERYDFESATLWMMEQQINWQMTHDRHLWFFATKRIFDFIMALLLLVPLIWLIIGVALVLKIADPRQPIFFKQLRTGWQTRPFWMIKFRTANPSGERLNHFIKQKPGVYDQSLPLVSKLLRRLSIDELPQIINVLKGDMSFIGPRPLSVDDTLFVSESMYARFAAPPGMTGLWQCQIPIVTNGFKKLHFDCQYVRQLGWQQDFRIMLRTLRVLAYKPFANELWTKQQVLAK